MTHDRTRRAGLLLAAAGVAVIAVMTLSRGNTASALPPPVCFLCSAHALAESLLNVALFLPFGFALGLLLRRSWTAVALGLALSVLLELVQIALPGRNPSVGDLLANTAGTLAGLLLARSRGLWLDPSIPAAAVFRLTWMSALLAGITATALLLEPDLPRSVWWAQWTPQLGHFAHYDGRVLSAALAEHSLPSYRLRQPSAVRRELRRQPLTLVFIAGTKPMRLAPIFSIADDAARQVLLIGARGDDLVIRYRTRARALRLDVSDVRFDGLLADASPGDTITLQLRWRHPAWTVGRNGTARVSGPSIADGVSLLLGSQTMLPGHNPAVRALCFAAILLPLGFWSGRNARTLAPAAIGVAAILLAHLILPLRATPPYVGVAAAAGVAAGVAARRLRQRFA